MAVIVSHPLFGKKSVMYPNGKLSKYIARYGSAVIAPFWKDIIEIKTHWPLIYERKRLKKPAKKEAGKLLRILPL